MMNFMALYVYQYIFIDGYATGTVKIYNVNFTSALNEPGGERDTLINDILTEVCMAFAFNLPLKVFKSVFNSLLTQIHRTI